MTGVVVDIPALGAHGTAPALERKRARAWVWVYLGLAGVVTEGALGILRSDWPGYPVPGPLWWPLVLAVVLVAVGVRQLVAYGRMRRTAATYVWCACAAVVLPGERRWRSLLVIRPHGEERVWAVRVTRLPWRPWPRTEQDAFPLWWAGAPGAAGIVALEDRRELIRAVPLAAVRPSLREAVDRAGAALLAEENPARPAPEAVRPVRNRIRWPWCAVLGLLLLGLGEAGQWSWRERDVLVEATVTAAEYGTRAQGDWCEVRWEDPFGGGERHAGRVSCPPDNVYGRWQVDDPLYLWIVADGPWRGAYYHHPVADTVGPGGAAMVTYRGLSQAGGALLTGCLLVLVTRSAGRERLRYAQDIAERGRRVAAGGPVPGPWPVGTTLPVRGRAAAAPAGAPDPPCRAGGAGSGWARAPIAPHPEVRLSGWWRVPVLWWRSGIPAVAIMLGAWQTAAVLFAFLVLAGPSLPTALRVVLLLLPLVPFLSLVVMGIRALIGIERVRALVRVARQPQGVPHRYELRYPEGGEPWLALFPVDHDPETDTDAQPVGLVALEPPTRRCPWPHRPEPTGIAFVQGYGPVVPRIEGEVFWPRG
ncbi:hypothetical protein [Streptomyces sp. XC 2026]|uniref:hypothetical protein n=1 Tax=Streptomyces sp. XC 2026 TaxID=2782004 RepID=UPI001905FDDF|nr:hypothetical protein [Streptomyces sp. XC 2026]QQN78995.1 hypothetical protein IPZ77_17295 [Streptomyces sp. XC 2026]